jgi:hypothetical protein
VRRVAALVGLAVLAGALVAGELVAAVMFWRVFGG